MATFRRPLLCLFCLFVFTLGPTVQASPGGGTVGDGTPASCTDTALDSALGGGGSVTFNCGGAIVDITLSGQKTISVDTQIDGGGLINLHGHGSRHFYVPAGVTLTLNNLTLSDGSANGDGGSIFNQGTVVIDNATLENNTTSNNFSGGAIVNYGDLTITNSLLQDNTGGNGGAVYPRWSGSHTQIVNTIFRRNHAANTTGWGGALLTWDGAVVVIEGSEFDSNTAIEGGALYNTGNSDITLIDSNLHDNTASQWGGAIVNNQHILIQNSIIANNTATYQGGGIVNQIGFVDIQSSTVAANQLTDTDGTGGNIANWYLFTGNGSIYGNLTVANSTVSGGNANYTGGGIFSYGPVTITNSSLIANTTAGRGGALFIDTGSGSVTIENSTLSGNNADGHGGGIYRQSGPLSIAYSTIAGNTSLQEGSNMYMDIGQQTVWTSLASIVAEGDCVQNGLASQGYNLDSGNTCGFDQTTDQNDSDPLLAPLADNSGPTLTRMPSPGSPAIDAIPTDGCPSLDQRGFPRPLGPRCDMGAVEFDGGTASLSPQIVLVPNALRPGSQLRAIGYHFGRNRPYQLFLSGIDTPLGDTTTDGLGHFDKTLAVPQSFSGGNPDTTLTVWSNFAPVAAILSQPLTVLPPLGLHLSTTSALPGATVVATVTNVYAGEIQLRYGSMIAAGPLPVGAGTQVLSFVVPLDNGQAPVEVQASNITGDHLDFGTASETFTPRTPGSFTFSDQPNASVQAVAQPAPAWTGNQKVSVTGALPDVPADQRSQVKVDVMFRSPLGQLFPLTGKPLSLNSAGQFNAVLNLPSLFNGDPLPSSSVGSVLVSARLNDVVKLFPSAAISINDQNPFGIRMVRKVAGELDGTDIPDTPTGALRLLYRAEGTVLADSDALDSAAFADALTAAFKSVYADQIGAAISSVVEKYNDCHPLIPQRPVQPWEMAWRPPDEFQLLASQQSRPLFSIGQIANRLNIGRASAVDASSMAAPVQVRFIVVTVDASEVIDGAIAPNGYGPPESVNEKRKIAYQGLYAVVPSTGKIFLVKGYDATNLFAPITFERLPDGPVTIALSPYPAGAKTRLEFDVTVPGANVLGIAYGPEANTNRTVPIRTFGRLYSFANFPVQLSIEGDALEIQMLINEGASYNQPPVSAVSMQLYLNGSGAPISLPVTAQNFGTDPCKGIPKVRFIAKMEAAYQQLPPGRHDVVVQVNDGLTHLQRRIVLQFESPPAWFFDGKYKGRRVIWSPSQASLSASRYGASDDTTAPGDLAIAAPKGPPPGPLHVNNASGLDNRVVQILTPSGPGALTQPTKSRSQAWNNTMGSPASRSADGNDTSLWPTLDDEADWITTPDATCEPGPFVQCLGPYHQGIPRTEMLLFPPILWGIPPIADVKIAGSLAYEAGVDVTGVLRLSSTPEANVTVWPYARVSVAIDVAGELLGGLIGRMGINTSGNVFADLPVTFGTGGKNDVNACFRWFVHMRIYVQAGCVPFTDACLAEDTLDERNLFDGRTPHSQFCDGLPLAAADTSAAPLPPSANPAIASDGVHMLAVWNAPNNELVYSFFDGNDWGAAQPIASGRIADRAAVAFYDANRAVAVWNGSDLTPTATGQTLDQALAHQMLEYALWDGTSWSTPARLADGSFRDGGAVLAGCANADPNCPAGGAVTAAWTHVESGTLVDHQLRVYTAQFVGGVWSAAQTVDPASTSADAAPMVTYAQGEPVVAWVRDSDRSFATVDDRHIALRHLSSSTVEIPAALPNQVVAGSMVADNAGHINLVFTRATDGAILSNRQPLYAAQGDCLGACVWTQAPLVDAQGRPLWGEHPVLTLDSHNQATVTYRATGFGANTQGQQLLATDAPGIKVGTGELAQVDLRSSFAPASPRALTHDGVLHWQPAAAYNAALDKVIALSVRGSGGVQARNTDGFSGTNGFSGMDGRSGIDGRSVVLADDLLMAAAPRTPDFVLQQATPLYSTPQNNIPQQVQVSVRNDGTAWSSEAALEVVATWDAPYLAASPADTQSLPGLDAGEAVSVTLTLPPPPGSSDADHLIFITVNPQHTIAESDGSNNETQLAVIGVSGPAQVYTAIDPADRLVNLHWVAPKAVGNVVGYRIYRRTPGGEWQSVGSSLRTGWADVNAQYNTLYEYAVSAYAASGFESRRSLSMQAIMSAPTTETSTMKLFLPQVKR